MFIPYSDKIESRSWKRDTGSAYSIDLFFRQNAIKFKKSHFVYVRHVIKITYSKAFDDFGLVFGIMGNCLHEPSVRPG